MNVRCEYCNSSYPETEEKCPYCGAPNSARTSAGNTVPHTIGELQAFCAAHRLPLQEMRFFIGEDYRGAKAFGIFKDENGLCTVYKNKADGSRSVRYRGTDEAYAVQEIYGKLKEEIQNQRRHAQDKSMPPERTYSEPVKRSGGGSNHLAVIVWVIIALAVLSFILSGMRGIRFSFNDGPGYSIVLPGGYGGYDDYDYGGNTYSSGSGSSSGSSSSWDSDWDDDWDDSDWDWDSGDSWDSDWTDWDSDW